jgi:hypothetical protein
LHDPLAATSSTAEKAASNPSGCSSDGTQKTLWEVMAEHGDKDAATIQNTMSKHFEDDPVSERVSE